MFLQHTSNSYPFPPLSFETLLKQCQQNPSVHHERTRWSTPMVCRAADLQWAAFTAARAAKMPPAVLSPLPFGVFSLNGLCCELEGTKRRRKGNSSAAGCCWAHRYLYPKCWESLYSCPPLLLAAVRFPFNSLPLTASLWNVPKFRKLNLPSIFGVINHDEEFADMKLGWVKCVELFMWLKIRSLPGSFLPKKYIWPEDCRCMSSLWLILRQVYFPPQLSHHVTYDA